MKPLVTIVVGSESDLPKVEKSGMLDILDQCGINWELSTISAHRNSETLKDYCSQTMNQGTRVFIGIAGMAAALPGVIAANTRYCPVIGVPLASEEFTNAIDALLSMSRMPSGCPVAVSGIEKAGLRNAAILTAQMIATGDDEIGKEVKKKLTSYLQATQKEPKIGFKTSQIKKG